MVILLFIIGIILVSRLQPIIIITIIVIIILLYSYFLFILTMRYWFRYILVIVILRGVLVVFTYIISLIPNEIFENYNVLYIFIFIIGSIGYYKYLYISISELISLRIWNSWYGILNIFIVSFLLIIILIVVWFRNINEGALRVRY